MTTLSRRQFCMSAVSLFAARTWLPQDEFVNARLKARPRTPTKPPLPGTVKLWEGEPRAFVFVPGSYDAARPMPMMVALHGAGQSAAEPMRWLSSVAQATGFLLVCPDSSGSTWDAIMGRYGRDVSTIDRALGMVFDRYVVDRKRIALAGFSDGASYALGLGLLNAEVFTKLIAFSPGFVTRTRPGSIRPPTFISHGRNDRILPFRNARDRVVPAMKEAGSSVEFHEFEGGHTIPPEIAKKAADFLAR